MTGGVPTDAPPVCPRHPDRVSYVRCQRCGRPACPECQRTAAVGVQCVDCVREGQKNVRQTQTVFGAPVRSGKPVVTYTIIGLCIAVYVLQQAIGQQFTIDFGFVPVMAVSEPWRFLTSAFLHASLMHILFNMWALWVTGSFLEPAFGRAKFITMYVLSAIGGSVGVLLFADPTTVNGGWFTLVVGASGAVFGLFGAIFVALRSLNRSTSVIVVTLVINVVIGFTGGIAWQAHLGGLITGAALGAIYAYSPRDKRKAYSIAGAIAIAVILVGLSVWKLAAAGSF